jgi:hypothetical protein
MKYPPVPNFAQLVSWSETCTLTRIEQEYPESPRSVHIKARLDTDEERRSVGNASVIHIGVHQSGLGNVDESFGNLSLPSIDGKKVMSASIKLAPDEFGQFIDFMRHYGIERSNAVYFRIRVYEPDVPEDILLYSKWEGKPFLRVVDFQYCFESSQRA